MRSILIGVVAAIGVTVASTVPILSAPANYSPAIKQGAANYTPVKECVCVKRTRNGYGCLRYSC
jgi:hypothetical protein